MTSAADALLRLASMTRTQDPALADWADQAGRRLAAGLDPARAMGMDKRTQARIRLQERNRYLREAYSIISAPGPWTKAQALADECRHFESVILPRWKASGGPPPGASRLRTLLWEARRLGRLPAANMISIICRGC